jgi:hypothetical protein
MARVGGDVGATELDLSTLRLLAARDTDILLGLFARISSSSWRLAVSGIPFVFAIQAGVIDLQQRAYYDIDSVGLTCQMQVMGAGFQRLEETRDG